mgnify:CR=1 FL=1
MDTVEWTSLMLIVVSCNTQPRVTVGNQCARVQHQDPPCFEAEFPSEYSSS